MRDLHLLDTHRIPHHGFMGNGEMGAFLIPHPGTAGLRVIAATGMGWDHVSVSLPNRCPNWPEMEKIKRLFFRDDETAMQLHVPPAEHIDYHPYCLHIWRPHDAEIPRPPAVLIGPTAR